MEVHRQLMQARRQDEDAMLRQAQDQARVPEPEGTVAPGSNESYEWYLFDIFIYNISNFVSVMIYIYEYIQKDNTINQVWNILVIYVDMNLYTVTNVFTMI